MSNTMVNVKAKLNVQIKAVTYNFQKTKWLTTSLAALTELNLAKNVGFFQKVPSANKKHSNEVSTQNIPILTIAEYNGMMGKADLLINNI